MLSSAHGQNSVVELNIDGGEKLTVMMEGDKIALKDTKGNVATVTIADVKQSNGVIHVIDAVIMPKD